MRHLLAFLFFCFSLNINFLYSQTCLASDGTEGVEIWEHCYSIQNTDTLSLAYQDITDTIPNALGNLTNLVYLNLSNNNIYGAIPQTIGELINLEYLDLSNNSQSYYMYVDDGIDFIPSQIGTLQNLKYLNLSNCSIQNIPPQISNLVSLEFLNLSNNNLQSIDSLSFSYIYQLFNLKELNLRFCMISLSLSSAISNLENLERIKISGNQFSGQLPSEIWFLENLKELNIGPEYFFWDYYSVSNNFSGYIPENIGNLSELKTIDLSENSFSGSIPQSIFNLPNLDTLLINNNHFSGVISENSCSFLSDNNSVYNFAQNSFCPPYPICNGNQIDFGLQLISNCDQSICNEDEVLLWTTCASIDSTTELRFSGRTPPSGPYWGSTILDSLTILPQIGQLINLEKLELSNLYGEIPSEIGNLTNLRLLDISNCGIFGSMPFEIGGLMSLETLIVVNNENLSGQIPNEIGNLSNLLMLDFSNNPQINGSIPSSIGNLLNLTILQLNTGVSQSPQVYDQVSITGALSGQIPPEIGDLNNLEILDISLTNISGNIPAEIGNLTNLKVLNLHGHPTNITQPGYIYDQWAPDNLPEGLTGFIPTSFADLTNLEKLNLSSNSLQGNLPAEILGLSNLVELNVRNNNLSGVLGLQISNLQNISVLDLAQNDFEGDLPIEIYSLSELTKLYLSANQFTGQLSPSISNLSNLNSLLIDNNNFAGPLPQSICEIQGLWDEGISIKINTNEFCPPYPSCIENFSPVVTVGHYHLPGDQYCEDCDSDYMFDGQCIASSDLNFISEITSNSLETANLRFDANRNGILEPFELVYEWDDGKLIDLSLSNMGLSGEIPSISGMNRLENLDLSNNFLQGPMPFSIGVSPALKALNISNNQITEFPATFISMPSLTTFLANDNIISDSIPSTIINAPNLNSLYLNNNNIFGNIPHELANNLELVNIDLSNNSISGIIPESMCQLQNLSYMNLDGNELCAPYASCITNNSNIIIGMQDTSACTEILNISNDPYIPYKFSLGLNYPNPFNPITNINYTIPKLNNLKINIYDITGRLVWSQIMQNKNAGYYNFSWNGKSSSGKNLAAGTYVLEMKSGSFRQTRKMVLLK